jgi:phosphoglycerate dehydrogenase-like enzyme
MAKLSHFKDKTRIPLLEGINDSAITTLAEHDYSNVELLSSALDENELIAQIRGVHIPGIRSRTQITGRALSAGEQLIVIGCFCIGTNQIDLGAARRLGIPVFNAPFSNTRSVAELVVGEIVTLMRGIFPKSQAGSSGRVDQVRHERLRSPWQDFGHCGLWKYRSATRNYRRKWFWHAGNLLRHHREIAYWKCAMRG